MPTRLRARSRRTPESAPSLKNKQEGWLYALELPYEATANFFGGLGRWISTRQTLSLLATALVICSLLSPAIILTFSPSGSPFDLSSSAITRRGRGELVWELEGMRRQGLIASEEEVCWDRITHYYEKTGRRGGGRRFRVEQVLVSVTGSRAVAGTRGTISKSVLHRAWKVQKELERRLLNGQVPGNRCLAVRGECATLSPAGWWKSEDDLLQDEDVHRTLSGPPPTNALAVPLTLSEAMVGVGRDRQGTVKSAQSIVITFFLEDEPDLLFLAAPGFPANSTLAGDMARDAAREAWRTVVRHVIDHKGWEEESTSGARDPLGFTSESRGPAQHVLLKFLPHLNVDAHPRRLENIIYAIGYMLVLLYVSRYIRKLRAHSKMGLLVTGVVELTASGIMSVSICWLLGWSLSLVPWNLLAFLVLTSGLDNMILVLRAISNTDMNLPVPQRMSQGLRAVGVEMTILLLVEEVMAGTLLWFVEINVMREWIRFGAVVLVVDYFLELTFFSTVLSIDIQRLELADLLAQNSSPPYQGIPSSASSGKVTSAANSIWSIRTIVKAAWRTLRDRPAKTSTVAFLWFINLSLWAFYGSEHYLPAVCSQAALSADRPFLAPSLSPAISRSLRLGRTSDPASSSHLEVPLGAGQAFWQLVNPVNVTSVQVYLEPTVSVQFLDDEALAAPESIDLLHLAAEGPSFAKKAILVFLPIAIVMGLLYLLLLYLLKDAELLEAHHSSEERLGGPSARRRRQEDSKHRPEAGVELVSQADKRHSGDVELIASGEGVVASWAGLEGKVLVQRWGENFANRLSSFTLDIPLSAEPTSLTALAIDGEGHFCAAATSKGRLLVWSLERDGALVDFGSTAPAGGPIVSLAATPRPDPKLKIDELLGGMPAPPVSRSKVEQEKAAHAATFFTLHRDGRVVSWDCGTCRATTVEADKGQQLEGTMRKWLVAGAATDDPPMLALAEKSGRLSLLPVRSERIGGPPRCLETGDSALLIAAGSFPFLEADDDVPLDEEVVVSGTTSGKVELHVLSSPPHTASIADLGSPIRQIRLVSSPARSYCPDCNDTVIDGLLLLASTRASLRIFRLFTPPTPSSLEPCICNAPDPTIVPRSRSSSTGLLGSPIMSRSLSTGVSRRFSPRKKSTTPSRPLQLPTSGLGESPTRPRLHSRSGNSSHGSQSSSSGMNTPTAERSQPAVSPMSSQLPPPAATLPPLPSSLSADASPPPLTVPLPPPAFLETLAPPPCMEASSRSFHLRAVEVASIAIDDRSGWETIDGKVVGLRRARKSEGGGRGWEVWSVGLGKEDAAFNEGFEQGVSNLADLLEAAKGEEDKVAEERITTGSSVTPPRPSSPSSLRRRNHPYTSAALQPSNPTSSLRPSPNSSSTASTIRFSAKTVDLPFSRARPVVSALGGTAIAVGLGNQVVLVQAAKAGWQHSGFLGL